MLDKGSSIGPGLITKSARYGNLIVNNGDAFHSGHLQRETLQNLGDSFVRRLLGQLGSTRHANAATGDDTGQAFAGQLVNFADIVQWYMPFTGQAHYRRCERMFGVPFETAQKRQRFVFA